MYVRSDVVRRKLWLIRNFDINEFCERTAQNNESTVQRRACSCESFVFKTTLRIYMKLY